MSQQTQMTTRPYPVAMATQASFGNRFVIPQQSCPPQHGPQTQAVVNSPSNQSTVQLNTQQPQQKDESSVNQIDSSPNLPFNQPSNATAYPEGIPVASTINAAIDQRTVVQNVRASVPADEMSRVDYQYDIDLIQQNIQLLEEDGHFLDLSPLLMDSRTTFFSSTDPNSSMSSARSLPTERAFSSLEMEQMVNGAEDSQSHQQQD